MQGNKRVYSYMEGADRISNLNHMTEIKAAGTVKFPSSNKRLECEFVEEGPPADLHVTSTNAELVEIVEASSVRARDNMKQGGMSPPRGRTPLWWSSPHLWESGKLRK